ncbi:type II secretion system major pseudopilin GspG [Candidatus Sumerlaeota bacterium]|nr:type II secretion system major pseudopilin GspG [Candidatus Sumerlaeota bacterium]
MRKRNGIGKSLASGGFTFLEIMLVVVIIGILAGIVAPRLVGRTKEAKIAATKAQMSSAKTALLAYEMRVGNFPSTNEGLQALVSKPSGVEADVWQKQMDTMPKDAWGKPFQYAFPSEHGMDFDLSSAGPDGQIGTQDDITNWEGVEGDKKL